LFQKLLKKLDYDWISVFAVCFLIAFGLVAIYSLSLSSDAADIGNFKKQIFFLLLGIGFFVFFSQMDYRIWKSYSGFLYLVGIILLVSVLLFGKEIRGTSGWFSFGFFNFQPVELMKLILILSLANYFSRQNTNKLQIKHIATSFLFVMLPVGLAIKQPDMGSAMVMFVVWLGMLLIAGLPKKYLFFLACLLVILPFFGWNFMLKDYQKERIVTFLDPQKDPLGSGYNVLQSIIAVGSGGIWGKGLGHGSQSRLNFLPEKHTDFIFATIAEESGMFGALLLLGLFIVLFFRLKKIADVSRDNFGQLIISGTMTMIVFQVFINIGMNMGIMPIAGLSLPFISYGGSFLIVMLALLGIIQSIWKKRKKETVLLIDDY
jgi:rod shape determining protein RodA